MSNVILRKFWLENESGDSIPLNGERGIWLIDPTGLGVNNNSSFTNFSYGFFRTVDAEKDPQQTIAGDLYFIDSVDPYMAYRRFADWVIAAETLVLVYAPTSTQFRRKIRLSYLTKTELMTQEALKVPIAMYGLTPWYTQSSYTIPAMEQSTIIPFRVGSEEDDSAFELVLDSNVENPYPSRVGSIETVNGERTPGYYNNGTFVPVTNYHRLQLDNRFRVSTNIYVKGQLPAGFVLQYSGLLVNPEITIRGDSGSTFYGRCTLVNTTIDINDTLQYVSDYEGSGIIKIGQFSSYDMIDFVENLSLNIYPKLPPNDFCTIELSADNEILSETSISLIEYYRGV